LAAFAFLAAGISFIYYNLESIDRKLAPVESGLLMPEKYALLQKRLIEIQPDVWIVSAGLGVGKIYDPTESIKHEQSIYDAKKIFTKEVENCIQNIPLKVVETVGGEIVDIRNTLKWKNPNERVPR
jgi:hypothetical protein